MKYNREFDFNKLFEELGPILNIYNDSKIIKIEPLLNGKNNLNFIVFTNKGDYVIKKTRRKKEEIIEEHKLLEFLKRKNLPVFPPFKFNNDLTFLDKDDFRYIIFAYIKGSEFSQKENEITSAAKLLGKYHKVVKNINANISKVSSIKNNLIEYERFLTNLKVNKTNNFDSFVLENLPFLINQAKLAKDSMKEESSNILLVHGDYTYDNLLFTKNGEVLALFDFENSHFDHLEKDVIRGISKFALKNKDSFEEPYLEVNKIRNFIEHYLKSNKEAKGILINTIPLLRYNNLSSIIWGLDKYYTNMQKTELNERLITWHIRQLRWIDSNADKIMFAINN